jgi:ribosomal protein S18 acetylase RimI-like enzyme
VATTDGEVVGYLVLEYTFYAHGFISMLYIHPKHRQHGIGEELLRHAENICTTDKLFTSANQSNILMQALLKKMDFMPSGRIENLDEGVELTVSSVQRMT